MTERRVCRIIPGTVAPSCLSVRIDHLIPLGVVTGAMCCGGAVASLFAGVEASSQSIPLRYLMFI